MQVVSPPGNLDSAAQDTQLRGGLVALAIALAVAAALGQTAAGPVVRGLVFVPFFAAAYGVLAALYGTCGFSAIAGRRITCQGTERIVDRAERSLQRANGVKVVASSLGLSVVATALFVAAS